MFRVDSYTVCVQRRGAKVLTAQLSADALTLFRGERCLFQGLSFALNPGELLLLEGRKRQRARRA